MKNEKFVRAMSFIDDRLIDEANETPMKQARILTPTFTRQLYRIGGIAACLLLVIAVSVATHLGGNDVRLYGESITDAPRTITEYMPRSVTHSISPASITAISLPLELEFDRSTVLTLDEGEMEIIDSKGDTIYTGNEYKAKGAVSICVKLPPEVTRSTISTNRGYNIVLELDSESGLWYVNIEK